MSEAQICKGCGKRPPPTDTSYTLISSRYGWRLTRRKGPNGPLEPEWRCPECWAAYKKATIPDAPPSSPRTSPPDLSGDRPTLPMAWRPAGRPRAKGD